ncbi:hypothetical protein [Fontibacter flavus]|uniref:DUF975 family protein n=1 Tax=Fontibacter flavus TaxID=654838 RepID=A0ABV6FRN4_9BACT|nr:hypothetical protein [Cyclobacteriaceae bacterium]
MSRDRLALIRERGYDFDIAGIIEKAWQMFWVQPLLSISYTLLIFSLQLISVAYLKDYAFLYALLLAPPLYAGYYLVANKISRREQITYPDFLMGFNYYWPVFSIWLIGQLITGLGIIAFIIPGIYLAVAYSFSVLMAIFGGFDFWTALEESRKLITVRWWKFLVFTLVLLVINLLTILTLGLGLLITIPLTFYATYILFEDLTKDVFAGE